MTLLKLEKKQIKGKSSELPTYLRTQISVTIFVPFRIHNFQKEAAAKAGVFHHLITLPTYHTAALSTDMLAKNYFSDMGMLAYVKGVQRIEIRDGVECVKHQVRNFVNCFSGFFSSNGICNVFLLLQDMAGTYIGDDHKEYFSGDAALKASGKNNTMNQFEMRTSAKA